METIDLTNLGDDDYFEVKDAIHFNITTSTKKILLIIAWLDEYNFTKNPPSPAHDREEWSAFSSCDPWGSTSLNINFKDEEDAMAFKLRWL